MSKCQNLLKPLVLVMFLDEKLDFARNPSTPPEILEELANDENMIVRTKVANNPNTSAFTLDKLVTDEDCVVRLRAAANLNTPLSTLEILAETQDDFLSFQARSACIRILEKEIQEVKNKDITVAELINFSKKPHFVIREAVAENPTTSQITLKELSTDKAWYVRKAVAENPNTPTEVLIELFKDPLRVVREVLAKHLTIRLGGYNNILENKICNRLDELLTAENWKAANHETRVVISQINRSNPAYSLIVLHTIDHLWSKFSNGRFGFSIQRKIYFECGGKLDDIDYVQGKKYDQDWYHGPWMRFAKRIGWNVGKDWVYSEN